MSRFRIDSKRLMAQAAIGGLIWMIAVLVARPAVDSHEWGVFLILFAALVLVPLSLASLIGMGSWSRVAGMIRAAGRFQFPAAIILTVSIHFRDHLTAGLLTLPWLLVAMLIAVTAALQFIRGRLRSLVDFTIAVGMLNLAVGGGWATLAAWGVRPLGFSAIIVLLTAVHFHYAGYLLPILAGLASATQRDRIATIALAGTIGVMPAVATGITITQLGVSAIPEMVAAACAAAIGILVSVMLLRTASNRDLPLTTRLLIAIAGLSLLSGMILAAFYGLRFVFPIDTLTIPLMRAAHGSLNAFGFGLCGLLGWLMAWRTKSHSD